LVIGLETRGEFKKIWGPRVRRGRYRQRGDGDAGPVGPADRGSGSGDAAGLGLLQNISKHTSAEKSRGTAAMSDSVTNVEAAISELVAAFPAAFTLDPVLVRPVKLGIKDDLYERSAMSHRRITAALRAYCNSVQYLKASIEGAVRIDLAGEPSGAVTATEAHHAREALAKSSAKGTSKIAGSHGSKAPNGIRTGRPSRLPAAPKGTKTSNRTPDAGTAPEQKRLSLSDLKRAAAARKANR
jgi:ProP effector